MDKVRSDVTALLDRWSGGDRDALGELIPLIFDDVRELARRALAKESPAHTLQPTALVSEVYLRLEGRRSVQWQSRQQFFGFLAQLIRRILVDHARRHHRRKRGSGRKPLSLDDVIGLAEIRHPELLAVDAALVDLAKADPTLSQIVELRFFIGLTLRQIASILEVSVSTVNREWATARMWLMRELDHSAETNR